MSINKQTVKKAIKKTTIRKKVVTLKNQTLYALARMQGNNMVFMTNPKDHVNHTVNSFLAHGGEESMMKGALMVEVKVIGKPIVKTTRNITIKK